MLWHRIQSAPRERIAPGDAPNGKPSSPQPAMLGHSRVGILATRWKIFALRDSDAVQQRRNASLVCGQHRPGNAFA